MRTRTAKTLAQRIDLNYFKRPHGMRRVRMLLSIAVPAAGLLWLGAMAAAGSRAPYSSGPVSSAHAFAEMKCEVCHERDDSFRAHVTDKACLTCHDGPSHPPSRPSAATARRVPPLSPPGATATLALPSVEPACASCHREHQGRVSLAASVPDAMCVECHGDLTGGTGSTVRRIRSFPEAHPEFAVLREAFADPKTVRFNHQVHLEEDLRGPNGPETLECTTCHRPELTPTRGAAKRVGNLMSSVTFDQQCARCHPLFFDERIDQPAPHGDPNVAWAFVDKALRDYITANPAAISQRDVPDRRIPLNFPRDPEPLARNADEWVQKRGQRARAYLERACSYCHGTPAHVDGADYSGPMWRRATMRTEWMARATFDHAPHLMVECASCHSAAASTNTADVLMPTVQTCATCHAPGKGASSQCVECHGYHDWSKARPVKPHFKLTDFR